MNFPIVIKLQVEKWMDKRGSTHNLCSSIFLHLSVNTWRTMSWTSVEVQSHKYEERVQTSRSHFAKWARNQSLFPTIEALLREKGHSRSIKLGCHLVAQPASMNHYSRTKKYLESLIEDLTFLSRWISVQLRRKVGFFILNAHPPPCLIYEETNDTLCWVNFVTRYHPDVWIFKYQGRSNRWSKRACLRSFVVKDRRRDEIESLPPVKLQGRKSIKSEILYCPENKTFRLYSHLEFDLQGQDTTQSIEIVAAQNRKSSR